MSARHRFKYLWLWADFHSGVIMKKITGQWLQQGGNVRQTGAALVPGPLGSRPPSMTANITLATYGASQNNSENIGPVVDGSGTVFFTDAQHLRAIDANGEDLVWSPWSPTLQDDSMSAYQTQPSLD